MKLLLDTHTFLWWDNEPAKLSRNVLNACFDPQNTLFLSVVSVWELQIKLQIGKLDLRLPLSDVLDDHRRKGLLIVSLEVTDILGLAALPMIHRDPFDRLLVSQARRTGFPLVSRDPLIANYGVTTLW